MAVGGVKDDGRGTDEMAQGLQIKCISSLMFAIDNEGGSLEEPENNSDLLIYTP